MTTPTRPMVNIRGRAASLQGEIRLSGEAVAAAAGISVMQLARLVRLGLIDPLAHGANEFTASEAVRLKRMLRLHRDLGVNLIGAAVILDLVARIDALEAERTDRRRS